MYLNLRVEVLKKLSEASVLLFLIEFKKKCIKEKVTTLPSSIYWIHAGVLYLHWILYYYSFDHYEKKYEINHSSAYEAITFISSMVFFFKI